MMQSKGIFLLKADFHSVEFSNLTGNPLLMCENVTLNLKRMLRVTKILVSKIQSARKILLSRNQPLCLPYIICYNVGNFEESY